MQRRHSKHTHTYAHSHTTSCWKSEGGRRGEKKGGGEEASWKAVTPTLLSSSSSSSAAGFSCFLLLIKCDSLRPSLSLHFFFLLSSFWFWFWFFRLCLCFSSVMWSSTAVGANCWLWHLIKSGVLQKLLLFVLLPFPD